ncbi:hypothetical protein EI94DRAFT_1276033 [Lactarius quietus]|nr:hypothetical protein EI94DRAFT_1276033 [Lactarius quietus]
MSSSSQVASSASNDQGARRDGPSAVMGDPPPPPRVKLTCYRLLNVTTVVLWAVPKAVLCYKNRSTPATTIDLLTALFGGILLYWVGLYEERPGKIWGLFFRVDLTPAFGHSAKYFFRGVVWALSFFCDKLVVHPLISLCLLCACLLLARYLPVGEQLRQYRPHITVVVIFLGLVVRATSGRNRLRIR